MGILSSYLLLFISFYFATYQKDNARGGRGRKKSETATRAAIDMSRMEVPDVQRMEDAVHLGTHSIAPAKGKENGGITPGLMRLRKG